MLTRDTQETHGFGPCPAQWRGLERLPVKLSLSSSAKTETLGFLVSGLSGSW